MEKIEYQISYNAVNKKFIDVQIVYKPVYIEEQFIVLQIPAWRPGRYELQQYAKNIHSFKVVNQDENPIQYSKKDINTWIIPFENNQSIKVSYKYYANQMDAGGSWVDEHQLYINPINCLMYVAHKLQKPCKLKLMLPNHYQVACGKLLDNNHELELDSYYELSDMPFIASKDLKPINYEVGNTLFTCWFQGKHQIDENQIISDFKAFTEQQLALFGDFPFEEYHFLIQSLPYHYYSHLHEPEYYFELLGISSHELFHAWNVCKIRPLELQPYNYSKPSYFQTGFVAEGFTTYYGDLMLVRAKVFTYLEYIDNFNRTLRLHFHNFGNSNSSLAESSFDLWLDGYQTSIPHRKVSIYQKGAFVACLLDWSIRKYTNHEKSLDDILQTMWNIYGKKNLGYTIQEIEAMIVSLGGLQTKDLFDEAIFGKTDLASWLKALAVEFGLQVNEMHPHAAIERMFGMKILANSKGYIVDTIAPDSPADLLMSKGDIILESDSQELMGIVLSNTLTMKVQRNHQLLDICLEMNNNLYFKWYELAIDASASEKVLQKQKLWLK
ncbi:MAG: M61 family peptidase [Cytophagales bacterium]|nr:MAG: M61 family peptidase [Cytophagales bacterium]